MDSINLKTPGGDTGRRKACNIRVFLMISLMGIFISIGVMIYIYFPEIKKDVVKSLNNDDATIQTTNNSLNALSYLTTNYLTGSVMSMNITDHLLGKHVHHILSIYSTDEYYNLVKNKTICQMTATPSFRWTEDHGYDRYQSNGWDIPAGAIFKNVQNVNTDCSAYGYSGSHSKRLTWYVYSSSYNIDVSNWDNFDYHIDMNSSSFFGKKFITLINNGTKNDCVDIVSVGADPGNYKAVIYFTFGGSDYAIRQFYFGGGGNVLLPLYHKIGFYFQDIDAKSVITAKVVYTCCVKDLLNSDCNYPYSI
jgi:hypothetical protein